MDLSRYRRIQNEQLSKDQNQHRKHIAKSVMRPADQKSIPVKFICECARPDCVEPIEITIEQFDKIHRQHNVFIVRSGHQQTDIENVAGTHDGYVVVQKPTLYPV